MSKPHQQNKKYDIILFGVTGFTGKLAAEYLLERIHGGKNQHGAAAASITWAVCARSAAKAELVLQELTTKAASSSFVPDILEADLLCQTQQDQDNLRQIVQQTKVVLTCAGPFEKYGRTLVQLCAEWGVYYADITGETDFFRQTIQQHDKKAQETGAVLLCHCGHDCIPCDLMVWEMNQVAQRMGLRAPASHHVRTSVRRGGL